MVGLVLAAAATALAVPASVMASDKITFLCSWDEDAPIMIGVDLVNMTATRNDGGSPYTVIKLTKWGVWLQVDQPDNAVAAAVQFIQRGAFITPDSKPKDQPYDAGSWTDVILSVSGGGVSAIRGGICWEQKDR